MIVALRATAGAVTRHYFETNAIQCDSQTLYV